MDANLWEVDDAHRGTLGEIASFRSARSPRCPQADRSRGIANVRGSFVLQGSFTRARPLRRQISGFVGGRRSPAADRLPSRIKSWRGNSAHFGREPVQDGLTRARQWPHSGRHDRVHCSTHWHVEGVDVCVAVADNERCQLVKSGHVTDDRTGMRPSRKGVRERHSQQARVASTCSFGCAGERRSALACVRCQVACRA